MADTPLSSQQSRMILGVTLALILSAAGPAWAQAGTAAQTAAAAQPNTQSEWRIGVGYEFMADSGSGVKFPLGVCGQFDRNFKQLDSMRLAIEGEGCFFHASVGVAFNFVAIPGAFNGPAVTSAYGSSSESPSGGSANVGRFTGGLTAHLNEDKKSSVKPYAGVRGGAITGGGTGWGFMFLGGIEYPLKPKMNLRVGIDFGFFHVPAGWTKEFGVGAGIMIPLGK